MHEHGVEGIIHFHHSLLMLNNGIKPYGIEDWILRINSRVMCNPPHPRRHQTGYRSLTLECLFGIDIDLRARGYLRFLFGVDHLSWKPIFAIDHTCAIDNELGDNVRSRRSALTTIGVVKKDVTIMEIDMAQ